MRGVLIDTSVWVSHFRVRNESLVALIENDRALTHPMVVASSTSYCSLLQLSVHTLNFGLWINGWSYFVGDLV